MTSICFSFAAEASNMAASKTSNHLTLSLCACPSMRAGSGYHMTSWHLVFALSGQIADFSDATNSSLTFSPKYECGTGGSYSLPVLLPGVVGVLRCDEQDIQIELSVGTIVVHHLAVSGITYPTSPVTLTPGKTVQWQQGRSPSA